MSRWAPRSATSPTIPIVTDKAGVPRQRWAEGYRRLLRPFRRHVVSLVAYSFAGGMLEAAFLVGLTASLLAVTTGKQTIHLPWGLEVPVGTILLAALPALGLRLLLNYLSVRASTSLLTSVTAARRQQLVDSYLGTPWSYKSTQPSGRLQELSTTFISQLQTAVSAITTGLTAAVNLIAFLSAGVLVDPLSTAGVLLALFGLAGLLMPLRSRLRRAAERAAESGIAFTNSVAELGGLGQEMHAYGVQSAFARHLGVLNERHRQRQATVQMRSGILAPIYTTAAYALLTVAIVAINTAGTARLATVAAVALLMLRSLSYGQSLTSAMAQLSSAGPYLETIEETVRLNRSLGRPGGTTTPTSATPLTLEHVSYEYRPEQPALSDISLEVRAGEVLGLIGPSGSGKSTIAQLIMGLRHPMNGTIKAGGVDLSLVDPEWWARRIAYVPQDAQLITGTVAENLRFFREDLSDEDLTLALDRAHLGDFHAGTGGLSRHLGQRGGELSGGQRQRVSIARALAAHPEVLVLDEPTSALDGESESTITQTLRELRGQVTIVLIAHRMATLELCDRIGVIENGRLTALDSPKHLRATSTFYRHALAFGTPDRP